MTRPTTPPRLLDERSGSDELLRTLLRSTELDEPSAADLAQLSASLEPLLPPGDGLAPAAPSAPPAQGVAALLTNGKVVTSAVVALVAAGTVGAWRYAGSSSDAAPTPSVVAAAASAREAPSSAPVIEAAPTAPAVAVEPPAAPTSDVRARAPRQPAPSTSRATSRSATPADEAALLAEAQAMLAAGNGRRALEIAREYRRAHTRGLYREEFERIQIEALFQTGAKEQARARARSFLQRHPRSAHRARIETLLSKMGDAP